MPRRRFAVTPLLPFGLSTFGPTCLSMVGESEPITRRASAGLVTGSRSYAGACVEAPAENVSAGILNRGTLSHSAAAEEEIRRLPAM